MKIFIVKNLALLINKQSIGFNFWWKNLRNFLRTSWYICNFEHYACRPTIWDSQRKLYQMLFLCTDLSGESNKGWRHQRGGPREDRIQERRKAVPALNKGRRVASYVVEDRLRPDYVALSSGQVASWQAQLLPGISRRTFAEIGVSGLGGEAWLCNVQTIRGRLAGQAIPCHFMPCKFDFQVTKHFPRSAAPK